MCIVVGRSGLRPQAVMRRILVVGLRTSQQSKRRKDYDRNTSCRSMRNDSVLLSYGVRLLAGTLVSTYTRVKLFLLVAT